MSNICQRRRWVLRLFMAATAACILWTTDIGRITAIGQDFRLPPAAEPAVHPLISRIAFGSCGNQDEPQRILRTVLEWEPELFVYLGDNIYGDTRDMSVLEAKYARLASRPEFRDLRMRVPAIATWDDHDYGENDAGRDYPFKARSKELFLKFWDEPADSPRRGHEGIYTSYRFEDGSSGRKLQIILLDTRTFRDPPLKSPLTSWKNDYLPDTDPAKTLLGEQQWMWLRERLLEPADLRIIGSSIQFSHEYNGWESWTNFPRELLKMVDLIRETRAEGVVFISGDVHWGELSVLKPPDCYPLYDLTASGLNQDWDHVEPNRNRLGDACSDFHFGMLQITWSGNPTIQFRIHDMTGRSRVRRTVRLSELRF
ncbi:MAG: Alkaline phosphatase precursor [Planctomycetota bacterium]